MSSYIVRCICFCPCQKSINKFPGIPDIPFLSPLLCTIPLLIGHRRYFLLFLREFLIKTILISPFFCFFFIFSPSSVIPSIFCFRLFPTFIGDRHSILAFFLYSSFNGFISLFKHSVHNSSLSFDITIHYYQKLFICLLC